jgi:hypothetical protein
MTRPLTLAQLYVDTSLSEKHQYWPPFRKAMSHFGTQDAMTVFEKMEEYVDVVAQSNLKPATIKKNLSYIFHIYNHMSEEKQQYVTQQGLKKLCDAIGYKRPKQSVHQEEEVSEEVSEEVEDASSVASAPAESDEQAMTSIEFHLAKQYIHELDEKVTYLSDSLRTMKKVLDVQTLLLTQLANEASPRLLNRFLLKHRDFIAHIPSDIAHIPSDDI